MEVARAVRAVVPSTGAGGATIVALTVELIWAANCSAVLPAFRTARTPEMMSVSPLSGLPESSYSAPSKLVYPLRLSSDVSA